MDTKEKMVSLVYRVVVCKTNIFGINFLDKLIKHPKIPNWSDTSIKPVRDFSFVKNLYIK